jgi:glycosyl transferase family 2
VTFPRGYPLRLYLVLSVVAVAILGAGLHPLSLILSWLPFDTAGLQSALTAAKTAIADFLAWALVSFLALMAVTVFVDRRRRRAAVQPLRPPAVVAGHSAPPHRTAVGIVAYDEAEAIAQVVADFRGQPGVIEVVVVDNNSRDQTASFARRAGARVVQETRQGYGHACMRALAEGLRNPNATVVVLVEGDGTFAAADLAKFASYVGQADLVLGTRVVRGLVEPGSQMDHFFTWGNIAVGTLLQLRFWHSQFLGAARLSDVGCTYRAIRREALERIIGELSVGGHHFSPDMMLVALARGLCVVEIPVTFRRRIGQSKGASQNFWKGMAVGLAMIGHILTYRPAPAVPLPASGRALPVEDLAAEGFRAGP